MDVMYSEDYVQGLEDRYRTEIESLRRRLQDGSPVVEATIQHMAMEIAALKKARDELAAALAKIQPGNELGTFLQNVEMPWAVCKELAEMEEALAKLGADKGE